jgi:uncharacterized membrane protein YGL010W
MTSSSSLAPRPIESLLETYAQSHRHPTNEWIHCVCVPAIVFSLLGLVWVVHPLFALGGVALSLVYYARLSVPFMLGMLLMSGAMLAVLAWVPQAQVASVCLVVFVLAWIGQFIGHKIEGMKPSFFDDLRFLLIGPLFVLAFAYRRLGIAY